jgi:hypothetical protein
MNSYTIKATTMEEFFASFPVQPTKITGQPAYDDIRQLRTVIYHNAASIPSERGGGQHGHLGMVMNDAIYATLTETPWVDPEVPGLQPEIEANATQYQIAAAHNTHNQKTRAYKEFDALDRALKRLITDAIEPLYLKPFYRPYVGLVGQSTKTVIARLIETYGYILPQELQVNQAQLTKPYDATNEPLQVLIDRFEEARIFADDGNLPITDGTLINAGIVALKNTGVVERYIDQWTDKPGPERETWLQFKEHFLPRVLEYQKGRRSQTNNVHTQFGMMAHDDTTIITAHTDPSSAISSIQDTINQANHLAMAGIVEGQQALIKQLAELQAQLTSQQNSHQAATPVRQNPRNRNNSTRNNNGNNQGANKDPNGYCWTHGYNVAHGHTSAKCRRRAPGHQEAANRTNPMGGSTEGLPTN